MYDRCVRTGLAALLVLCTLVQDGTAIDLSRLYGHHNKRELMVNGEQSYSDLEKLHLGAKLKVFGKRILMPLTLLRQS